MTSLRNDGANSQPSETDETPHGMHDNQQPWLENEDEQLSELSYEQLTQLHGEVLRNWTSAPKIPAEYDILELSYVRGLIIAVYVVIITVGVFGNGLVVVAAARRTPHTIPATKGSQSATYVFVLSLAVSDLALCVFSLPLQLHYQLTDRWRFGAVLCRVIFAAFAVPMYLSTVTILLIAVDRYRLIVQPFGNRLSARSAALLVAVNVVISTGLAAPVVHYTTLQVVEDDPDLGLDRMDLCVERWSSGVERRVYSVITFLIQFCLPLVITAALYGRIYARLRLRRRRTHTNNPSPAAAAAAAATTAPPTASHQLRSTSTTYLQQPPRLTSPALTNETASDCYNTGRASSGPNAPSTMFSVGSRTGKTNQILVAIVTNFVVCWLPWNVFGLVTELDHRLVRGRHFKLVDLALKGFAMGSACVNPLLYCWLNENLRRDIGSLAIRLNLYRRRLGIALQPITGTAAAAGAADAATPLQQTGTALGGPGGARIDLPRFQIQPPSCHNSGARSDELRQPAAAAAAEFTSSNMSTTTAGLYGIECQQTLSVTLDRCSTWSSSGLLHPHQRYVETEQTSSV